MDFEGGEGDETEEGKVGFFVANGQPPVFLELAEEHLDTPSPAIDGFVVDDFDLAVLASGDDRNIVIGAKFATMIIAVVAHVFDDVTTNDLGGQRIRHADVGDVAARQLAFDNLIVRRDGKMEFGRYARAVFAACAVPPFEPPP